MEDETNLLLGASIYQPVDSFGLERDCSSSLIPVDRLSAGTSEWVVSVNRATHLKNELNAWHDYGIVRLFHESKRSM